MKCMLAGLAGLLIVGGFVQTAEAHVQATDNGVSIVMHVLPDDNPVALQKTYMQFSFGGSSKDFELANCQCRLKIQNGPRQVAAYKVEPLDEAGAVALVATQFPAEGVYNVVLSGYSGGPRGQTFVIEYTLRVAGAGQGGHNSTGSAEVILISLASLSILGIVAERQIRTGGRYVTK